MARIKFGAIIVDTRGSIGGTTIKWTRAGAVMQTHSYARNRLTPLTALQRERLSTFGQQWYSTLTEEQRTDWRAFALANPLPNTWGDDYPLSGIAQYVRTNLSLAAIDATPLSDAPTDLTVTALATLTLSVTAPNTATLTFTPTPTPANHVLLIKATPASSPGVLNFDGKYLQIDFQAPGETSPLNIAAAYNALVGNFLAGARYAIAATLVNTTNGARGPLILANAIAT